MDGHDLVTNEGHRSFEPTQLVVEGALIGQCPLARAAGNLKVVGCESERQVANCFESRCGDLLEYSGNSMASSLVVQS